MINSAVALFFFSNISYVYSHIAIKENKIYPFIYPRLISSEQKLYDII